jgi:hypothetical protein
MPGVDDTTVGFGGTESDLFTHLQDNGAKSIARQFTGNRTADNPTAYDGNVIHE